ncbi:MAG: hypothetical protein VX438_04005 [Planctomycetota bacterium]|nr:hypothetical protein [Planctomycetota bacterium]
MDVFEAFPAAFRLGRELDSWGLLDVEVLLAVWVGLPPHALSTKVVHARSAKIQSRRIVFLEPGKWGHSYRYYVETAGLFPIPVFYGQKACLASEIKCFSSDFRRLRVSILNHLQ